MEKTPGNSDSPLGMRPHIYLRTLGSFCSFFFFFFPGLFIFYNFLEASRFCRVLILEARQPGSLQVFEEENTDRAMGQSYGSLVNTQEAVKMDDSQNQSSPKSVRTGFDQPSI